MEAISNILKVKVEDMATYVEAYINNNEPLMITGAFGVGKSQIIREVGKKKAEELGLIYTEDWDKINDDKYFVLIDIELSQLDPSDIKGIPDLDRDNKSTTWYIPNWFPKLGSGIIFFDEINLAPESVQNTCYKIINDRELAGHKLPSGFSVIMAGNRGRDDGARVNKMQVPLLTRMGHIEIEQSFKGWLEWATDTGRIDIDIVMYLQNNMENIWRYEVGTDGRDALCPRLWEKASKFLHSDYDIKIKKGLLSSILNVAVSTELIKFIELRDKYDIMKIIKGKQSMPDKIDDTFSVISGILLYYKEDSTLLKDILNISIKEEEFKLLLLKGIKGIAYKSEELKKEFKELLMTDEGGYKSLIVEIFRN